MNSEKRNCLYFYSKDYIEKAVELGVGDKDEIPASIIVLIGKL